MSKILIDEATVKLALEAAYLAGFNASGEGYNGEYPFMDHGAHPAQDAGWVQSRDAALKALAEQPAQQEPVVITEQMAFAFHNAITDGALGTDDMMDIMRGLEAAFAHITTPQPALCAPAADGVCESLDCPNHKPVQQEPEKSDIFCGVDFADGMLSVSVLRRRADDVAELLHAEQIEFPAQQELTNIERHERNVQKFLAEQPAQPAQRKPLTDEEIKEIFLRELGDLAVRIPPGWRKVVNAIEAAHGIKENA